MLDCSPFVIKDGANVESSVGVGCRCDLRGWHLCKQGLPGTQSCKLKGWMLLEVMSVWLSTDSQPKLINRANCLASALAALTIYLDQPLCPPLFFFFF